jgi:UDP-GlcNAc:undecaprenyl-phosphate GlcNAc-1-phosphate transferase
MAWQWATAVGCSFVLSWLLTVLLVRVAPRLGLVDRPGQRKVHTQPVPVGGGCAIYLTLVVTVVAAYFLAEPAVGLFPGWVVAAGLILVVIGVLDDARPVPWPFRLVVQVLAAVAILCLWSQPLSASPGSWLDLLLGAAGVVWIVGLVNAFNMLDNMDALSSGVAVVAAVFLVIAAGLQPAPEVVLPLLLFVGAVAGFLWFNWPPARIFMGDAGSTFLGFFVGVASLQVALAAPRASWSWLGPLGMLAVPWYDLTAVVLLRLWQGRSPFEGDKQHLSHRLSHLFGRGGSNSPAAVRVIYLLGVASGIGGLALFLAGEGLPALVAGGHLLAWWLAVAVLDGCAWRARAKKE